MRTSEAETVNNSIRWPTKRTSGIKYNYALPEIISMKMFVQLWVLSCFKESRLPCYDLEPRAEEYITVPGRSPNKELNLLEIILLAKH